MSIVCRLICLILGYLCGLFETGVFYGKLKGVDLREHGSGNSGTTNALRVLGPKAGIVVFIGDFCKSFLPALAANLIFRRIYPDAYLLYSLYAGFGAVLGHVFPFYLKFHGGKGIASAAGTIVGLLDFRITLILGVLFLLTVAITRYVSVGSICMMLEFVVLFFVFSLKGMMCFDNSVPSSREAMIESMVLVVLFAALTIARHKSNLIRLKNHTENKLF